MSIKPILFNTQMVQAILDGKKTVTRRLVKAPENYIPYGQVVSDDFVVGFYNGITKNPEDTIYIKAPYKTGDILHVRETWTWINCLSCDGCICPEKCPENPTISDGCYVYRATEEIGGDAKWHPSIHMPKEAARIWLKVTGVYVERLQDIDGQGVLKEGLNSHVHPSASYFDGNQREMFEKLWNSTIKKSDYDKFGWDTNPFVWVVEFERCEKPEPCVLRGMEPAEYANSVFTDDGALKLNHMPKHPCIGYGVSHDNDEPCEMCKRCRYCSGNDDKNEEETHEQQKQKKKK